MEKLTEKQQKVLQYLESFAKKHERSPTLMEIQKHFGFRAIGTVQDYIKVLERKGHIQREAGRWASIELTRDSNKLPLLGKVAAGRPIEHLKHDERIEVPQEMLRGPGPFFVLQVSGDSMINEGIIDGDYVVVRQQKSANTGDIVVALFEQEATIKRLVKRRGYLELHSANEKYAPIPVRETDHFSIEGVFCGLLRYA